MHKEVEVVLSQTVFLCYDPAVVQAGTWSRQGWGRSEVGGS